LTFILCITTQLKHSPKVTKGARDVRKFVFTRVAFRTSAVAAIKWRKFKTTLNEKATSRNLIS